MFSVVTWRGRGRYVLSGAPASEQMSAPTMASSQLTHQQAGQSELSPIVSLILILDGSLWPGSPVYPGYYDSSQPWQPWGLHQAPDLQFPALTQAGRIFY